MCATLENFSSAPCEFAAHQLRPKPIFRSDCTQRIPFMVRLDFLLRSLVSIFNRYLSIHIGLVLLHTINIKNAHSVINDDHFLAKNALT